MNTYKYLEDETELKFFWDYILPPLKDNEAYFLSVASRNKQLTDEEKEHFKVGRSEMFAKQIIRHDDYKSFVRHIRRFETVKDAYHTKAGLPYPDKSLVMYTYICPLDAYNASSDLIEHIIDVHKQLTNSALKQSPDALKESWYKVRKVFDSSQSIFAKNHGTRVWIDIDMDLVQPINCTDTKFWKTIDIIRKEFEKLLGLGNFAGVWTAGGIHWLIRKSVLNFNPESLVNIIRITLNDNKYEYKEVIRNDNEQIPLPGTLQYGNHLVSIINKEDFCEKLKFR